MTLLSVRGLTKRFGGLAAVDAVSFDVPAGTITGLIGPNGAGKSTLFSMVAGAARPTSGRISFNGEDVTGWQPHQAAAAGVGRTFQLMRVFGSMTVLENLTTAAYLRHRTKAAARARAEEVCASTGLAEFAHRPAATLTGATKKRLELARALATSPRLLLLDEVLSGLTPTETAAAIALIRQVHADGITIVLVEHVMQVVMSLCPRLVVLDFGKLIFEGSPADAVADQAVLDAYLGGVDADGD
jgi:branched-chain amino acid transport system ATP-binding protein